MFAAILRFLICVAAIPACAQFMDGVKVLDMGQTLLLGVALGVIYTVLRPVGRMILAALNFCTLGLLYVAVDGWLVWTAAGYFAQGVQIESFWWALAVALVMNAARMLVDALCGR